MRARKAAGGLAIEGMFRSLAAVAGRHPKLDPATYDIDVVRDVPYASRDGNFLRLDVYRPRATPNAPAVLYVHGGGFRILSKDTHVVMALWFARRGYTVFNIDYRLAPAHPFPAALEDAAEALGWVHRHGAAYGADVSRLVMAGESAGANLVTGLAIATSYRRPELYLTPLYDLAIRPRAVVPACGILQVSDVNRFHRRKPMAAFLRDRAEEIERAYVGLAVSDNPEHLAMADPLLVLENAPPPSRPLPPFFAGVGTRDFLLDDTRRLKTAVEHLGGSCSAHYYPGEVHAFQAFVWRKNARDYWRSMHAWLATALANETT